MRGSRVCRGRMDIRGRGYRRFIRVKNGKRGS